MNCLALINLKCPISYPIIGAPAERNIIRKHGVTIQKLQWSDINRRILLSKNQTRNPTPVTGNR